jgi:aldehyde dehydrogenase (NAD+)
MHDFIQQLIAETKRKFSDKGIAFEKSTNYARIVDSNNLHRIKNYLEDAVAKGAKVELGGKINEHEKFIEPTVLSEVSLDSLIMQEEIFGPVLPVVTFKTFDDVLSLVKSKHKPLNAYIFSKNKNFKLSHFLSKYFQIPFSLEF